MDRLYDKGYIDDPKSKAKSVMFTDEGYEKSKALFEQLFGMSDDEKQDSE